MSTPEAQARIKIDALLEAAGWKVFDLKDANLGASSGVAIREYQLKTGPVDYLFFISNTQNKRLIELTKNKKQFPLSNQ